MKEFDERISGDEVFVAEEHRLREFALADITADRSNVFVQEFGDLAGCVEVKLESHLSPMNFLILYRVLSWGFEVLPLRMSAIAECDIFRNIAVCWRV